MPSFALHPCSCYRAPDSENSAAVCVVQVDRPQARRAHLSATKASVNSAVTAAWASLSHLYSCRRRRGEGSWNDQSLRVPVLWRVHQSPGCLAVGSAMRGTAGVVRAREDIAAQIEMRRAGWETVAASAVSLRGDGETKNASAGIPAPAVVHSFS